MPTKSTKPVNENVQPERTHFQHMLAKNPNYFGNIPGSKIKPNLKFVSNTQYEEITCVGYNPDTQLLEATFSIKKPVGYSGQLCFNGTLEHIRFYLDLHDGDGFIDQGTVAVNVHDIPAVNDCTNVSIFPIMYVAQLKQVSQKLKGCDNPVLPTLRAILSWNQEPPANSPNWNPVWGNVMDCDIQFPPIVILSAPQEIDFSKYFKIAATSPNLTVQQVSEMTGVKVKDLIPEPKQFTIQEMAKKYEGLHVPASRYLFKEIYKMTQYPTSEITMLQKSVLDGLKIDYSSVIDKIAGNVKADNSKANIDYEELQCLGLDYNSEFLVASIKIKKKTGYNGDLCHAGSKEYVAFWIDWDNTCNWTYLNTVELKVHEINMAGNCLCYQVSLPLDTTFHKKLCENPNIIKVRGVLSWNVPPSTVDSEHLQFYGNRIDAHIQIKPGTPIDPNNLIPIYNIIGGIDVNHVDDLTGLTTAGSFFAYNGSTVPTGAPFGGIIVINGPLLTGNRYRIKVTNMNTGVSYYLMNTLTDLVGYLPHFPWVQYTNSIPDANGYYNYLSIEQNTLSILARFTPGTDDKLLVELEIEGVPGTFGQVIQMDNTAPVIKLEIDNEGDCTYYSKGALITGHYYVNDLYINSWRLANTWTGAITGTTNTDALPGNYFEIQTQVDSYPCGSIGLWAEDKTIVNSQYVGYEVPASYIICLQ